MISSEARTIAGPPYQSIPDSELEALVHLTHFTFICFYASSLTSINLCNKYLLSASSVTGTALIVQYPRVDETDT